MVNYCAVVDCDSRSDKAWNFLGVYSTSSAYWKLYYSFSAFDKYINIIQTSACGLWPWSRLLLSAQCVEMCVHCGQC